VAFTDTERLIGDAAKNQVAMNAANTVFDAKRLIGNFFNTSGRTAPFLIITAAPQELLLWLSRSKVQRRNSRSGHETLAIQSCFGTRGETHH
jgi:molecular chaperone DnaK (HSP70)